jgi:hypothetical protein
MILASTYSAMIRRIVDAGAGLQIAAGAEPYFAVLFVDSVAAHD